MFTDILQGPPLFSILFLFFNVDLVGLYVHGTSKVAGLSCMNDVNILACEDSTEANCQLLEKVPCDCIV